MRKPQYVGKTMIMNGKSVPAPREYYMMWKRLPSEMANLEDLAEDERGLYDGTPSDHWETIQLFLFGDKKAIDKKQDEDPESYKIKKRVSLVAFEPRVFTSWGITTYGHGGPVCLVHCSDYGNHSWCHCCSRTMSQVDPEWQEMYKRGSAGRPTDKERRKRRKIEDSATAWTGKKGKGGTVQKGKSGTVEVKEQVKIKKKKGSSPKTAVRKSAGNTAGTNIGLSLIITWVIK